VKGACERKILLLNFFTQFHRSSSDKGRIEFEGRVRGGRKNLGANKAEEEGVIRRINPLQTCIGLDYESQRSFEKRGEKAIREKRRVRKPGENIKMGTELELRESNMLRCRAAGSRSCFPLLVICCSRCSTVGERRGMKKKNRGEKMGRWRKD